MFPPIKLADPNKKKGGIQKVDKGQKLLYGSLKKPLNQYNLNTSNI